MKKCLIALLIASLPMCAEEKIQDLADNTDKMWRAGSGAQDGAYTALATSMLGWGLGLTAGIAILAAVLHQSTASHNDNDNCCGH